MLLKELRPGVTAPALTPTRAVVAISGIIWPALNKEENCKIAMVNEKRGESNGLGWCVVETFCTGQ